MTRSHGLPLILILAGAVACAQPAQHFPLRDPLWQDTDTRPVAMPCTKDEKGEVACAPQLYVSPLAWDGVDNTIFRPLAHTFALDPAKEAVNVNAFDEVPSSAWFVNRLGARKPSREELLRGACTTEEVLVGDEATTERWVIDQGKANGSSPGFRIKVDGKRKYLLKTDSKEQPERPSAASVIGAAIYHAVGYNTSCEQIVVVEKDHMKLLPRLTSTSNAGVTTPFDSRALDAVFEEATHVGTRGRFQASSWLPGRLIGPFQYERTRRDDPNDVIAHDDRRDLRGARVVAAWLNHFDAREQNSMDSWISASPKDPTSPGFVRHYYLDTSDCFGSEWAWDGISRRLGHSYLLDFGDIGTDFVGLGIPVRSWEQERRTPGLEIFGYFHWRTFEPDGWKNEYPNPSFLRATEHDNAWMARILSRFDEGDIRALVELGKFSNPKATEFLATVLEMRLRKIAERYLLRLSPLSDVTVDTQGLLCATDLARRRHVRPDAAFRYAAERVVAGQVEHLNVIPREAGKLCMPLGHRADDSLRDDSPERYSVITVANSASQAPLRIHLYDLGSSRGFRLVGLERPNP